MDNIVLLGVVGSIFSILSLFISLFGSNIKNHLLSNNHNSFNNTLNQNSNNKTTNNYDFRTTPIDKPISKSSNTSEDLAGKICIGAIIGFIVISLYLKYQDIVIFYVITFGIIGLLINLLVLFALSKIVLLDKLYLCSNTLKWFPLFIMLIYIYHPSYGSNTLNQTKQSLKLLNLKTLSTVTQLHAFDVLFFATQIIGLAIIVLLIALNIFKCLKQLYKTYIKNQSPTNGNLKDFFLQTVSISFLFILISGLYVRFFNYINLITNPK